MNVLKNRPLLAPAVLAVALWIAGLVVTHQLSSRIPSHATDAQLLAWVQGNTNPILVGGWLWLLGCLSFLWFAALLRTRLAEAEGGAATYATLAFAGAAIATALGMLIVAGDMGAAIDKDSISAATAGMLHNGGDLFFVATELALVPFFVGAAAVALRRGVLPKWWSVFAVLIALVLAVGPIGWIGLIFATPLWILGTGLLAGRAARVPRSATGLATA